jgi:hypothetical protein
MIATPNVTVSGTTLKRLVLFTRFAKRALRLGGARKNSIPAYGRGVVVFDVQYPDAAASGCKL